MIDQQQQPRGEAEKIKKAFFLIFFLFFLFFLSRPFGILVYGNFSDDILIVNRTRLLIQPLSANASDYLESLEYFTDSGYS